MLLRCIKNRCHGNREIMSALFTNVNRFKRATLPFFNGLCNPLKIFIVIIKQGIKINILGDLRRLPANIKSTLKKTIFLTKDNKKILDQDKGAGWWLWKPYYILEVLKKSKTNDFIIYSDCGDMFSQCLKPYIETTLNDNDISLLLLGNAKNGHMTKRDCFIKMNCDETDYHESNQLEAGFQIWRVCDESIKIVEEWLNYCLDFDNINIICF